jgi:hypothetical protein
MSEQETITVNLPVSLREEFDSKLLKLNKKLAKIASAAPVTVLSEKAFKVNSNPDLFGNPTFVDFLEIVVSLPVSLKRQGFEYLGTISYKDGVKTIFAATGKSIAHIEHRRCDHCGHNRQRNLVHVFDHNGKDFTIGSKCVEEYFGLDVFKALNVFKGFLTYCNEVGDPEGGIGSRGINGIAQSVLLAATGNCEVIFLTKSPDWLYGQFSMP